MSKTIIFCADGTWDGAEDAGGESVLDSRDVAGELAAGSLTNVVKLYANLAGAPLPGAVALRDEDEKILQDADGTVLQVAHYLRGVGDSTNPLVALLGGVFGVGVIARIVRGYTFISRYYQPGDAVHVCGFSRGAYTARALAGMIAQVGLLDPGSYDPNSGQQAYRLGAAAWAKSKSIHLHSLGKLTPVATKVLAAIEAVAAMELSPKNLRADVPVSSVAVWDTVGSLGIPEYVKGERVDVLRFVDTALSPKVSNGFHAMSVDELRRDFPVTRWDARPGITQVWFSGAHSDVGGGYPTSESALSDLTLRWLTSQLSGLGVRFATPPSYVPNLAAVSTQPIHTPWTAPPFDHLGRAARDPAASDAFDPSVRTRWEANPAYRPAALTPIWGSGR
jgi:uncharacterized protein (DUF2235 family)